jgi:cytochrome b involved in lipid metabolism
MPEKTKGIFGPLLKLFKVSPVKVIDDTDQMDTMGYAHQKKKETKGNEAKPASRPPSKSPEKKPTIGTGGKEDIKPIQKGPTGDSKKYPKGLFVPIPLVAPEPTYSDKKIAIENEKKVITMKEVQKHCARNDGWTVISGVVYDVTQFISQHPGGSSAITKILGKDGTAVFSTR